MGMYGRDGLGGGSVGGGPRPTGGGSRGAGSSRTSSTRTSPRINPKGSGHGKTIKDLKGKPGPYFNRFKQTMDWEAGFKNLPTKSTRITRLAKTNSPGTGKTNGRLVTVTKTSAKRTQSGARKSTTGVSTSGKRTSITGKVTTSGKAPQGGRSYASPKKIIQTQKANAAKRMGKK